MADDTWPLNDTELMTLDSWLTLNWWHLTHIAVYYMALSHKDWELPNSRIWLAETYIDRGLEFPI